MLSGRLTRQLIGSSNKQSTSSQLYSTIYALSSGLNNLQNQSKQGVAIAVLRVSGPETKRVLNSLTNGQFHRFEPRQARLTNLYNKHRNNDLIDKAIAIWFPKVSSEITNLFNPESKIWIRSVPADCNDLNQLFVYLFVYLAPK